MVEQNISPQKNNGCLPPFLAKMISGRETSQPINTADRFLPSSGLEGPDPGAFLGEWELLDRSFQIIQHDVFSETASLHNQAKNNIISVGNRVVPYLIHKINTRDKKTMPSEMSARFVSVFSQPNDIPLILSSLQSPNVLEPKGTETRFLLRNTLLSLMKDIKDKDLLDVRLHLISNSLLEIIQGCSGNNFALAKSDLLMALAYTGTPESEAYMSELSADQKKYLLNVEEIPAFFKRESLEIIFKDPIHKNERKNLEYEKHEESAVAFLTQFDRQAQYVQVQNNGIITFSEQALGTRIDVRNFGLDPHKKHLGDKFNFLLSVFSQRAENTVKLLKETDGVIDAKVYLGAIIVTYDSSKATPLHFPPATSPMTGAYIIANGNYLGMVYVDINPQKIRNESGLTGTAFHELCHHGLSMTNFLLTQDAQFPIHSAYPRNTAHILQTAVGINNPMTMEEALGRDTTAYAYLLGRPVQSYYSMSEREIAEIQQQQAYLEELHSQFQERNQEYLLRGKKTVYSREKDFDMNTRVAVLDGTNGYVEDIDMSRLLLSYAQIFYCADYLIKKGKADTDLYATPQQMFCLEQLYLETGACIGVAKSLVQAESLVRKRVIKLFQEYTWMVPLMEQKYGEIFPDGQAVYVTYILRNLKKLENGTLVK